MSERKLLGKRRLATIVDGTFAIAMTLLIFDIKLPDVGQSSAALYDVLIGMFPIFLDYLLSFVLLGFFWVAHNYQFRHIGKIDERYIWVTMLWLMLVVLIPFSTKLVGEYGGLVASELFFHFNIFLILLFLYLQATYVDRHRDLVDADKYEHESFRTSMKITQRFVMVSIAGVALTFWIPDWSNLVYFLVPLFGFWERKRKRKA
ncbi:MAG: TMEM175 family protein [Candidatus Micrarchaeia archaeon]